MQPDSTLSLSTHLPNINTQANTSNTATPLTKGEARKYIKTFVSNNFDKKKINANLIHIDDLKIFFTHKDCGKYYLNDEFHNSAKALKQFISDNISSLSFMN